MARSCSHGFLERPTCLQHILTIIVQHLRSAWMTWSWMETSVNGWSTQLFHHQEPRHIKHFVIGIFLSQTTGVATTRKLPLICEVPPYCNGFKTWQWAIIELGKHRQNMYIIHEVPLCLKRCHPKTWMCPRIGDFCQAHLPWVIYGHFPDPKFQQEHYQWKKRHDAPPPCWTSTTHQEKTWPQTSEWL